jgi:hypothetical protein
VTLSGPRRSEIAVTHKHSPCGRVRLSAKGGPSETTQVHHASRRCGGVAAGGARSVIGYLGLSSPEAQASTVAGFRKGLVEAGYVEDRNVAIEFRWAESQFERFPPAGGRSGSPPGGRDFRKQPRCCTGGESGERDDPHCLPHGRGPGQRGSRAEPLAITMVTAILLAPAAAVPAEPQRPYSCRLLDDAQRKCAFGQCDQREIERLKKECLRDGGRP